MQSVVDPGEVILDEVTVIRARICRDEALIAQKLLEFEDFRTAQAAHLTNLNDRALAEASTRDELSLTLMQPVGTVYHRLSQTRIVRDRMPLTWAGFGAGAVDAHQVGLIGAAANKLSDNNHFFIELDYGLTEFAAEHTGSQLKVKLNRFVARIEPDQAAVPYTDEIGELAIFAEPMYKAWNDIVVDISSIPDTAERPRAEVVDRLLRAFEFAGWTLIEENA